MKDLEGKVVTTKIIKDTIDLHNEKKDLSLDQWEIRKILKKFLWYSWRKPQIRSLDAAREDVVINRRVFRAFIRSVSKKKAWFIFVDESYFNPRNLWYRSWVSKANPSAVHSLGYSKGVATICALTDQGVLYSVLWKGTNTAWEILLFFIDLEWELW